MISGKIHSLRTVFALALESGKPISRDLIEVAHRNLGPILEAAKQLEASYAVHTNHIDPAAIETGKVVVMKRRT